MRRVFRSVWRVAGAAVGLNVVGPRRVEDATANVRNPPIVLKKSKIEHRR
jgi:hypothetical protein